jgi:hypothetical protein
LSSALDFDRQHSNAAKSAKLDSEAVATQRRVATALSRRRSQADEGPFWKPGNGYVPAERAEDFRPSPIFFAIAER